MITVQECCDDILDKWEGSSYTNNPSDSGGPTRWGVTLATLSHWRGKPCTAQDVQNLSRGEAMDILVQNYIHLPRIDTLPVEIQPVMIDWGYNAGDGPVIKHLQTILDLPADGVIGPKTQAAAAAWEDKSALVDSLCDARKAFYSTLAQEKPQDREFLVGWIRREESFRC